MTGAAEGAVDDGGAGFEIELFQDFGEQDGFVVGRGRHRGRLPSLGGIRPRWMMWVESRRCWGVPGHATSARTPQ